MGKVIFNMSVSLDGFVAGPNDEVDKLFGWYSSGDTEIPVQEGRLVLKVSQESAAYIREFWPTVGAIVTGRRLFDMTKGWGGTPPLGVHHFVVTHRDAPAWVEEAWPFTFVTDGIGSAVAQAKEAAGDKHVAVGTATTMQQCLAAGLLDELHLDLVPVLLGEGIRLFGNESAELERIRLVEAPDVTHLQSRVVKETS